MDHLCYLCLVFFMLSHLFIAALWSPAGKGLTSLLLFVMSGLENSTRPLVFTSASGCRASENFYISSENDFFPMYVNSFCDAGQVPIVRYFEAWMFNCVFVTFPCGILGQVWYLIVSIPDLCRLSYF